MFYVTANSLPLLLLLLVVVVVVEFVAKCIFCANCEAMKKANLLILLIKL